MTTAAYRFLRNEHAPRSAAQYRRTAGKVGAAVVRLQTRKDKAK